MRKKSSAQGRQWALLAGLVLLLAACNLDQTVGGGEALISGVPQVRIASPLPNATFLEGVSVNIQAAVSNAGADIDRVEVLVDNAIDATIPQPNEAGTPAFSVAHTWKAEGAGSHTISVVAFRGDGSSSTPATVSVTVVAQGAKPETTDEANGGQGGGQVSAANADATATRLAELVKPDEPTASPEPTEPPPPTATETPSKPMATFSQGVNVRSGPSTLFNPPIGSFATGQTADILGKTPAGDWYKVRYYNAEGWVFGQLMTISGDTSQIPNDPGPPVPTLTPVPPTAVPVTATPATTTNLVAGNARFDPGSPKCKQTFNIYLDVANLGQQANSVTGTLSVDVFAVRDGAKTGSTTGAIPIIQPGQTVAVGPIPITLDTYVGENHKLVLVVDSGNVIPETNDGDNRKELEFTLNGPC